VYLWWRGQVREYVLYYMRSTFNNKAHKTQLELPSYFFSLSLAS